MDGKRAAPTRTRRVAQPHSSSKGCECGLQIRLVVHHDRFRHHQAGCAPALVGRKFVLADAYRLVRGQEGARVHLRSVFREERHLGIVLRVDEVDAFLVDDVVQHCKVRGIAREWHQETAVGLGTHQQKLVRVGPDEVERLGSLKLHAEGRQFGDPNS